MRDEALNRAQSAIDYTILALSNGNDLTYAKACLESALTAIKQARSAPVQEPSQYQELREVLEDLMDWQVKNVKVWHNRAYDNAQHVLDRHKATPPAQPAPVPLTQQQVVDGFCKTPHQTQYVAVFDAGVRFAEAAHGITKGQP